MSGTGAEIVELRPKLVGLSEIRDLLVEITHDRVVDLACRDDFPKPMAELAEGDVWFLADVQAWVKKNPEVLAEMFSQDAA